MANTVCDIRITDLPLALPSEIPPEETGAIVDFLGVVRMTEDDTQLAGLRYEAYGEMAEHQLRVLADECLQRFELNQLVVHHRLGFVRVGETSLIVRVASQHRAAAFEASAWIVDELKKRLPIWKHPVAADALASVSARS